MSDFVIHVCRLALLNVGLTRDVGRALLMHKFDPSDRVKSLALMHLAQLADTETLTSVSLSISRLRRRQLFTRLAALHKNEAIDSILKALKRAGDLASVQQQLYFASASMVEQLTPDEFCWLTSTTPPGFRRQETASRPRRHPRRRLGRCRAPRSS